MVSGPSTSIAERVIRQHISTQPKMTAQPLVSNNQEKSQKTPHNNGTNVAKTAETPINRRLNWWLISITFVVAVGIPIAYVLMHN